MSDLFYLGLLSATLPLLALKTRLGNPIEALLTNSGGPPTMVLEPHRA